MKLKLIVTVPETHADIVREAIGKTGKDKIGNYGFCSFSTKGVGRFRPEEGARPAIGRPGKLTRVFEERIEFVCAPQALNKVLAAIKKVHPYEEPAIEMWEVILP